MTQQSSQSSRALELIRAGCRQTADVAAVMDMDMVRVGHIVKRLIRQGNARRDESGLVYIRPITFGPRPSRKLIPAHMTILELCASVYGTAFCRLQAALGARRPADTAVRTLARRGLLECVKPSRLPLRRGMWLNAALYYTTDLGHEVMAENWERLND